MKVSRHLVRLASSVSLMTLAAMPLQAQRFGIIAGGTFSNLRNSDDFDFSRRSGTTFGASLQLPIGSMFTLQPEALFLNKGTKFKQPGSSGTSNVRLDYFEIPLLLRYDISRETVGPHIYAGPSVGFNTGCKVELNGNTSLPTTDCTDDDFKPKTVDYGFTVGAGVDLNLGGIGLTGGLRYGIGLADIRNDNSDEFKSRVNNGVLTAYVGLLFGSLKR